MKKILMILVLCSLVIPAFAAKLINGDLSVLKGENFVKVTLNMDSCVYLNKGKSLDFTIYLDKHQRSENWQSESLAYFIENFNKKTSNHDLVISEEPKKEFKYELILVPLNINSGGNVKGVAYVVDHSTNNSIATILWDAEGDSDDKITLRDNMKDAGKDIGSIFSKALNKKDNTNIDDPVY